MKTLRITMFFLTASVFFSRASAAVRSETTNGLYLIIAALNDNSGELKTNDIIQFDDRLVWMPFNDSTNTVELTTGNVAYFVKIKMTDSSGKEIRKTALGEKYGSKWDSLHDLNDLFKNINDVRPSPCMVEGSFKDNTGLSKFFPKPNELFQVEKSGIYTLEIQMQMFYPNSKSVNPFHKDLFQFSPIKIQVEKTKEK